MSKYSSKSINNYGNCNDSSYGKHRRNCSPNASNSRSRSGSPDNWSPNRSAYANKSSYSRNKDRDRERDRERDKYYESKKKSSNCRSRSRSPIDSKQSYKSVNNHSSHDINNESKSSSNRNHHSRSFGEWSERTSSLGKKYYYNHRTHVSQWEKPKEWTEADKRHLTKSDRHSSHSRDNRDKSCVPSSNSKYDLSSGHREKDSSRTKLSGSASSGSNNSVRSHSKRDDDLRPISDSKRHSENRSSVNCVKSVSEAVKSPTVSSNESLNTNSCKANFVNNSIAANDVRTQAVHPNSNHNNNNSSNTNVNTNNNNNNTSNSAGSVQQLLSQILNQQLSPTQSQALQRVLLSSSTSSSSELSHNFPEETLRAIQQALHSLSKVSETKNHSQSSRHRVSSSPRSASAVGVNSESPVSTSGNSAHHSTHHHTRHHPHHYQHQSHHQSADSIRQELDLLINRANINKSPVSEKSGISSTRHDSPPSSVTNISSAISSASLKPSVPTLTPSLANFFREDLVSHVTGWQAEHAERQVFIFVCCHWRLCETTRVRSYHSPGIQMAVFKLNNRY